MVNSIYILLLSACFVIYAKWQTIQNRNNKNIQRQLMLLQEQNDILNQQMRILREWFLEIGTRIAAIKDEFKDK